VSKDDPGAADDLGEISPRWPEIAHVLSVGPHLDFAAFFG
jgi:hypothetical protein